jgi:A/G-specific adenine glycosylase
VRRFALLTRSEVRKTQRSLLAWFTVHRRDLPWRNCRDPYWVWISEVMLQQTRVATVIPYFERWIRDYPNISELSQAREDDVLKVWEGLGYYSRARNLMRGARHVMTNHAGHLPRSAGELRQIPGIGRYTAGAIASLAFDLPEPVLDGNVSRVLCRLRDLAGNPRKAPLLEQLWSLARQLVTDIDAARLNESLMELGALVCTRNSPKCTDCPLTRQCLARKDGRVEERPQPTPRPSELKKTVQIILARRGTGQVLLQKQDQSASHWANLWTFPFIEGNSLHPPFSQVRNWLAARLHCGTSPGTVVSTGKYSITRFRFTYVVVQVRVTKIPRKVLPPSYAWIDLPNLCDLAMPAPHRRLAKECFERSV